MRAIQLALLELRSYLRDRADLSFTLLLPIALLAIMVGAFGQGTSFNGVANIVDQDGGPYATRLIQQIRQTKGVSVHMMTASEADSKLAKSSIVLATFISPGFSQQVAGGQPASVLIKQRGNGGQEGQIIASIVRGAVGRLSSEAQVHVQVRDSLAGSGLPESQINGTVDNFLAQEELAPAVGVFDENLGKPPPDAIHQFLPGIVTMFALFALSLRSQALVEERHNGTLERLLVTRLGAGQLFIGKFLSGVAKGIVQVSILFGLAAAIFHIFTVESFFSMLLVAVLFTSTVAALGLVIASVSRTREQASWISIVLTLFMSMLGGTFFEVKSGFLHVLAQGTINYYANSALKTLLNRTGTLSDLGVEMLVIAGVGLVALLLARGLFKVMPGGR
jgi:ABC-2 type transport system permease protein